MEMIHHGAEKIVNSKEDMMVNDDIDDIIRKGEDRTKELNEKYAQVNIHDLANFTSEGGTTLAWEGEDYGAKRTLGNLYIEPSKRERKTAYYSVDGYYRDAMQTGARKGPLPQKARAPTLAVKRYDFQFFSPRLHELVEKETSAFRVGSFRPLFTCSSFFECRKSKAILCLCRR